MKNLSYSAVTHPLPADEFGNRNILKNSRKRAQEDLDPAYPTPKLRYLSACGHLALVSSSKNAGRSELCSDYKSEPMGHSNKQPDTRAHHLHPAPDLV